MKVRTVAISATAALALAVPTIAQPLPAAAGDSYFHRARIINTTSKSGRGTPVRISFRACQNWGSSKCASGQRMLPPGKSTYSYFGWIDADGYYIGKGYYATDTCKGGSGKLRGEIKESGSLIQPHNCYVRVFRG